MVLPTKEEPLMRSGQSLSWPAFDLNLMSFGSSTLSLSMVFLIRLRMSPNKQVSGYILFSQPWHWQSISTAPTNFKPHSTPHSSMAAWDMCSQAFRAQSTRRRATKSTVCVSHQYCLPNSATQRRSKVNAQVLGGLWARLLTTLTFLLMLGFF